MGCNNSKQQHGEKGHNNSKRSSFRKILRFRSRTVSYTGINEQHHREHDISTSMYDDHDLERSKMIKFDTKKKLIIICFLFIN